MIAAYEQKIGHEIPIGPTTFRAYPTLKGTHWLEKTKKDRFPKLTANFADPLTNVTATGVNATYANDADG